MHAAPVATIVCAALMAAPARRRLIVAAIVFAASATPVAAQGRPHYRAYAMGDSLLAISRQVGLPVIDATTTPAVSGTVQELRWHARYVRRGTAPSGDPVDRLVFSFYEHRLFRIVVDYAPDRTDGMTESDMVGRRVGHLRLADAPHARVERGRPGAGATGRNRDCGMDQRRPVGRPPGAAGTDGVPADRRLLGAPEPGARGRRPRGAGGPAGLAVHRGGADPRHSARSRAAAADHAARERRVVRPLPAGVRRRADRGVPSSNAPDGRPRRLRALDEPVSAPSSTRQRRRTPGGLPRRRRRSRRP